MRIVVQIRSKDNYVSTPVPRYRLRTSRVRIIDRYILREFVPFFIIALGVTMFVLMLDKLLRYVGFVLGSHLHLLTFWRVLSYTLATVSGLVLPIAFLIASILTWNRLSTDGEYVALKAAGISLYRLLAPLFMMALAVYGASSFLLMYGSPWGFQGLRRLTFDMARRQAYYHLRPQEFHDAFRGLVLYVEGIRPERRQLEGVFIADTGVDTPHVITARRGEVITRSQTLQVVLRLHDGAIHRYRSTDERYYVMRFDRYDVRLELDTELARRARRTTRPRELFPSQLWQEVAQRRIAVKPYGRLILFWHQQFALPFTCLIFAALGPVLGIVQTRSGRTGGYVLGCLTILVYYVLFMIGNALGAETACPRWLAAWLPNFCMAGITILLLRRTARGTVRIDMQRLWAGLGQLWQR